MQIDPGALDSANNDVPDQLGPHQKPGSAQPILGRFLAATRLAWSLARRTLKVRADPTGWGG